MSVMKAYLVARVSTEEQKDAIQGQAHRLIDYAKRQHLEYELIEILESAYKGNRNEFKAVVAKIEASRQPVMVVFDKVDRYTRDSTAEETRTLQKLYRSGKIELHFPSDNLVVHKNSPATDIMRLGLNSVLAQYYSDAISDNVKRRQQQKLRDGEWPSVAPFGYKNITRPDGKKDIIQDEHTAPAVREAYKLYLDQGYSFARIAKHIRTKYAVSVSKANIERTLKNPFYSGIMRYNGELHPHRYQSVVSKQVYQRVMKPVDTAKKVYAGLPYAYRGLIECANCSCLVSFERKKQKYVLGRCTQAKGKHGAQYIHEHEVTAQVKPILEKLVPPAKAYKQLQARIDEIVAEESSEAHKRLPAIEAEIKKYENRLSKLYDDYMDGNIAEEFYKLKSIEYTESRQNLLDQKSTFELGDNGWQTALFNLLDLSKEAPKIFDEAENEDKKELLQKVLSNLQLDGKLLRWKLKKPFELMAFCNESQNWLPRRDSNYSAFIELLLVLDRIEEHSE